MMFRQRILLLLITVLFILTGGCNSPVYNQSEANVADVKQRQNDMKIRQDLTARAAPSLIVNQGVYVDRTPVNLQRSPSWLHDRIIFRGDQLPFSYYSRAIANGGGKSVLTRYQVGLDPSTMVSINYAGDVKGALDLLAAKTGYVYTISGCNVYWQEFVTHTYDVAFMPGASDYMMGKTGGSSGTSGSPGGGTGAGGAQTVVQGVLDNSADSEYSNLKGTLSVWADLEKSIKQLLSKDGTVVVSQSTTTVTVRDRPSNVSLISHYIANLNHTLSRQVLVKVEVLDVNLENDFNFGINWDAVKTTLGGQHFLFNGNYGTPIIISPLTNTAGAQQGFPELGTIKAPGAATGVTALASALTQQGKVSIVTQPRVLCLNNQVSVIRITNQAGYLASVQTTTLGSSTATTQVNNNTVTSQITPGSVITGLTLYILPKIMNDRVYLQLNADLSVLNSITNISSQGNGDAVASSNAPLIQVPNVTFKQFNQRAMIKSGDTLILAGFKAVRNEANAMQLLNQQALGGKGASQRNTETIVLVTPIILPGYV